MNRQEKLTKIYEEIADKSLSNGCVFIGGDNEQWHFGIGYVTKGNSYGNGGTFVRRSELPHATSNTELCGDCQEIIEENEENGMVLIKKIIGHPIHMGHSLERMKEKTGLFYEDYNTILNVRSDCTKTLPLPGEDIEGREDTIDFLFDMIEKYE